MTLQEDNLMLIRDKVAFFDRFVILFVYYLVFCFFSFLFSLVILPDDKDEVLE